MQFIDGDIIGVETKDLKFFEDERGWLSEIFRHDELNQDIYPAMSYISMTKPGVKRGPHEHVYQTDYFAFYFSQFKVFLWDKRSDSPTYKNMKTLNVGKDNPKCVIIPPGVVHAYKNIGSQEGFVLNFPNKLFAGREKKEPVDEIRYEDDPNTIFKV